MRPPLRGVHTGDEDPVRIEAAECRAVAVPDLASEVDDEAAESGPQMGEWEMGV